MPVAGLAGREGPTDARPGQALPDMRVVMHIRRIVEGHEAALRHLPKSDQGQDREQAAESNIASHILVLSNDPPACDSRGYPESSWPQITPYGIACFALAGASR